MQHGIFAFLIWLIARLERPLRQLCAPPLPVATLMRWWLHPLWWIGRPWLPRPATIFPFHPGASPYLLYPLTCTLLE